MEGLDDETAQYFEKERSIVEEYFGESPMPIFVEKVLEMSKGFMSDDLNLLNPLQYAIRGFKNR